MSRLAVLHPFASKREEAFGNPSDILPYVANNAEAAAKENIMHNVSGLRRAVGGVVSAPFYVPPIGIAAVSSAATWVWDSTARLAATAATSISGYVSRGVHKIASLFRSPFEKMGDWVFGKVSGVTHSTVK